MVPGKWEVGLRVKVFTLHIPESVFSATYSTARCPSFFLMISILEHLRAGSEKEWKGQAGLGGEERARKGKRENQLAGGITPLDVSIGLVPG